MPFRRRKIPSRRRSKKTFGRRRPIMRRFPRPEQKYNDVSNNVTVTTTPHLALLNGVVKGTDAVSRLGQVTAAASNFFVGFTKINVAASESVIRIALILDHQPDGLAFTMTDVFTNADTISPRNVGNGTRFKILFEKRYALSVSGPMIFNVKSFKKLYFKARYNLGNAGTIADIQTNSLYILAVSNEATNGVALTYQNRFRWIDP